MQFSWKFGQTAGWRPFCEILHPPQQWHKFRLQLSTRNLHYPVPKPWSEKLTGFDALCLSWWTVYCWLAGHPQTRSFLYALHSPKQTQHNTSENNWNQRTGNLRDQGRTPWWGRRRETGDLCWSWWTVSPETGWRLPTHPGLNDPHNPTNA